MIITVPLTPEEEARLTAIARDRGVSPDALIKEVVQEILEKSQITANDEVQPDEREKQLEELFATFDSVKMPAAIREEAFHRENWYR